MFPFFSSFSYMGPIVIASSWRDLGNAKITGTVRDANYDRCGVIRNDTPLLTQSVVALNGVQRLESVPGAVFRDNMLHISLGRWPS
jgi:hypothetical protein